LTRRTGENHAAVAYMLTIREGGKVTREQYADLDVALGAIERRGVEIARSADRKPRGGFVLRRLEPVQQVVARLELAGSGRLRVGVDVRGDGSSEAFTGRVRRRLIEQRGRETAYEALRRAIAEP
jgi:hypothetical protein